MDVCLREFRPGIVLVEKVDWVQSPNQTVPALSKQKERRGQWNAMFRCPLLFSDLSAG